MEKVIFIFLILLIISCQGQKDNKKAIINDKNNSMVEKFDFEKYDKAKKSPVEYTKEDGTHVVMVFNEYSGGSYYEYLPSPSFLTVYKEFYVNGKLKKKEIYIGENVKVGISRYYDEKGNLIKEVNEDLKFGKIKPQQVLEFLQEKGYINLKTGEGRLDKEGQPVFELSFNKEKEKKVWYVTIIKGKFNNYPSNFPDIGEPSAYIPIIYLMDGETGKVRIEGEENKKTSGIYKTYKGKDYSQEEWEVFEQKEFEKYARKHNMSLTKNEEKGKLPPSHFLKE